MERDRLEDALQTLGETLADRGQSIGLLIVGGGSLLLLGLVARPTADVDIVGVAGAAGYEKATELPEFLTAAVEDVGNALGLRRDWLNSGPTDLMDFGLPVGLEDRVTVRRYGALEVHLPGREDLICFKLYAVVDQGPRSKHAADLRAMRPTEAELLAAARWTRSHDPSLGFLGELCKALAFFGVEVSDDDL